MALLCFNSFSFPLLDSSLPVSRVPLKTVVSLPPKCLSRGPISTPFSIKKKKSAVIVAAVTDDGETPEEEGGGSQSGLPPPETMNEVVAVDRLPLESKLKEREEQRLRMKLAKKIRLRRKRLVRKRRLRKKGRWPPSKMKKLKNV